MKRNFFYGASGILMYLAASVLFWGNFLFALPFFLVLFAAVSYLLNRGKSEQDMIQSLMAMNIPLIAMLSVSILFTKAYVVIFPFIVLTPLISTIEYYLMSHKYRRNIYVLPVCFYFLIAIACYSYINLMNYQYPDATGILEYIQVLFK